MHARVSLLNPASISNRVAPASGLITGATAARIRNPIRLSLQHDGTVRGPKIAAFAYALSYVQAQDEILFHTLSMGSQRCSAVDPKKRVDGDLVAEAEIELGGLAAVAVT
jgi:hypothetical protein